MGNEVGKTFKDLNHVHDNLEKLHVWEEKQNLERGDLIDFKLELINSIKIRSKMKRENSKLNSPRKESTMNNSCDLSPGNISPDTKEGQKSYR